MRYQFLVHTFSFSLQQKIPKAIVRSLRRFVDIPVTARISLEAYMGDTHVIMPSSFKLCKQDGRMVIEKTSFSELIAATSLQKTMLCLSLSTSHHMIVLFRLSSRD